MYFTTQPHHLHLPPHRHDDIASSCRIYTYMYQYINQCTCTCIINAPPLAISSRTGKRTLTSESALNNMHLDARAIHIDQAGGARVIESPGGAGGAGGGGQMQPRAGLDVIRKTRSNSKNSKQQLPWYLCIGTRGSDEYR